MSGDSRTVGQGDLYAAIPGAHSHGADFVGEAVEAGAVAVLTDPEGRERAMATGRAVVVVPDPRSVLGPVAAAIQGHPDRQMLVLGVTGTNGKTTTTYLLDAGLRAAGHRTGLVGTIETRVGDVVVPSVRTTPEAADVQRLLARMVDDGCTAVSMEVSSHALALGRVDGTTFDVALFTNLSQDHLDFHPTLEDYFAAKAELFTPARSVHGVVDVDTSWGQRLAREADCPGDHRFHGQRAGRRRRGLAASRLACLRRRPCRQWFDVSRGGTERRVGAGRAALPGSFNVANALAALATLVVAGVPVECAVRGVAGLAGVPGRMERVDVGQPFLAVVDYAHTPEAVATLLTAVRSAVTGPVVVVLGCGGDRDPHKRPAMGAAAVGGADVAILTSDNPRSEDPLAILAAMSAGAEEALGSGRSSELVVEPDRAAAIGVAVRRAVADGAVVVAGKGHETGQEVAGQLRPFDDRVVLAEALRTRIFEAPAR